jgi:predicted amidohydrolase YtcJ
MRLRLALLTLLLASSALAQPADMVLRGGRVITVDSDWHIAQAVAVKDGRFVAVGDDAAVAARIGPNTQVIELAGKTVVPGLIDTHLHQLFAALKARRCNCSAQSPSRRCRPRSANASHTPNPANG